MLIGYARVSTKNQSLDLQLEALKKHACERIFSEKVSGTATERPELGKCLDYLRQGDTLVVWKLDRLGRSLREIVKTVTVLAQREVIIQSITENIDTSSPTGKMIFHIFALIAEYERDLIKERVQAAREAAQTKGASFGRPRKLGLEDLQEIKRLKDSGFSISKIAVLKKVSRATLYRFLHKR
jgi:DNA invertase Pin-like site-specific DNA recombinase